MKKLNISIVLFNSDVNQIFNILNTIEISNIECSIYLVDNSPTNKILRSLELKENVYYWHNPSNPGYGASHNKAINETINQDIPYHLVLNPDVSFSSEALKFLISFMDNNPYIGNVMPRVVYPDGSLQYLCKLLPTPYDWIGRRFNPFKKILEKRNQIFELRFSGYDQIMDVPYLSGCFMFLRVDALRKVGLFDENIFMYGEETDLCRRLISRGYRTVFNPSVSIIHEFQKGSHKSLRLTWIGIKSAIYYFNKWGWFFDRDRRKINNQTLENLLYNNVST
jgi:GT2 family glycosyltransferase